MIITKDKFDVSELYYSRSKNNDNIYDIKYKGSECRYRTGDVDIDLNAESNHKVDPNSCIKKISINMREESTTSSVVTEFIKTTIEFIANKFFSKKYSYKIDDVLFTIKTFGNGEAIPRVRLNNDMYQVTYDIFKTILINWAPSVDIVPDIMFITNKGRKFDKYHKDSTVEGTEIDIKQYMRIVFVVKSICLDENMYEKDDWKVLIDLLENYKYNKTGQECIDDYKSKLHNEDKIIMKNFNLRYKPKKYILKNLAFGKKRQNAIDASNQRIVDKIHAMKID